MKILVVGGTGSVGTELTGELLRRGCEVRVLTRDASRAAKLGAVEPVEGDLLDPDSLSGAFGGVDAVFLLNAVSQTEASEGLVAVSEAMASGVRRIVYLSVHRADRAPYLPHFGSKLGVEAAVKASGMEWTILRPSNFAQADIGLRAAIVGHGVYPQPLGDRGVNRVDIRDVAEMGAIALTEGGHAGRTIDVIGPRPLTGAEVAEIWGEALGREVRYTGQDVDAWAEAARPFIPGWLLYDLKRMYEQFRRSGLPATPADVEAFAGALGHAPRSFETWASETASGWLGA